MKKTIRRLLSAAVPCAFAVLSAGCGQDYVYVGEFPEQDELSWRTVPYDTVTMYSLEMYPLSGGYRLVEQTSSAGQGFALLDRNLNEIVRFGRLGRGPEEFLTPCFNGSTGISGDSLHLQIRDWPAGILYRTAVSLRDGNTHSEKIAEYPSGTRAIYSLGNGRFLCNSAANRYFFDDNGTETYLEGWGEDVDKALEKSGWYNPDNQTREFFSPDSTRLLVYSGYYPILYLHSTDDGSLLSRTYVSMRPEEFPERASCPLYFNGGGYLGDRIVLLQCDDSRNVSRILVFDGNLKPLVSYEVPFVDTLQLDPGTGEALSLDRENELIYVFDLSRWLKQ